MTQEEQVTIPPDVYTDLDFHKHQLRHFQHDIEALDFLSDSVKGYIRSPIATIDDTPTVCKSVRCTDLNEAKEYFKQRNIYLFFISKITSRMPEFDGSFAVSYTIRFVDLDEAKSE